jgi:hypothetical protein
MTEIFCGAWKPRETCPEYPLKFSHIQLFHGLKKVYRFADSFSCYKWISRSSMLS